MKARIDHDECIGDGICSEICSEVFELRKDGLSYVINESPGGELAEKVKEAVNECPTGALSLDD